MTGVGRYLKELYKEGKATNTTIGNAVSRGWITKEEYKEITGEDYV